MNEDNIEEFAGTCRGCGGNVSYTMDEDGKQYKCENTKCEFNEGEYSDNDPEWVD